MTTKTTWDVGFVSTAYNTPTRYYHTYGHALSVHNRCWELCARYNQTPSRFLVLAAIYHDVAYDVMRHDNEELSADLVLKVEGSPRAAMMIRKTTVRDHLASDVTMHSDFELACLLDADLESLAYPYESFKAMQLLILREWGCGETDLYRSSDFLSKFLEKSSIYRLPDPVAEAAAVSNIRRLIAEHPPRKYHE